MARAWLVSLMIALLPVAADPFADRPSDAADLASRLAAAHAGSDLVAMLNLFDWRGLDAESRHAIEAMIVRDLGNRLVRIGVMAAPPDMTEAPGTVPNRVVSHLVAVEYAAADGRAYVSIHRVGEREGVALIALPVPAH